MLGIFSIVGRDGQQRGDGLHAAVAVICVSDLDGIRLPVCTLQRIKVSLASWATASQVALTRQRSKGGQHGRAQRYLGQGHVAVDAALGDLFTPLAGQRSKGGALDDLEANVGRGLEERHHNLESRVVEGFLQVLERRRQVSRKGAFLSKQHSCLVQVTGWVLEQADGLGFSPGQGIGLWHAGVQ